MVKYIILLMLLFSSAAFAGYRKNNHSLYVVGGVGPQGLALVDSTVVQNYYYVWGLGYKYTFKSDVSIGIQGLSNVSGLITFGIDF